MPTRDDPFARVDAAGDPYRDPSAAYADKQRADERRRLRWKHGLWDRQRGGPVPSQIHTLTTYAGPRYSADFDDDGYTEGRDSPDGSWSVVEART